MPLTIKPPRPPSSTAARPAQAAAAHSPSRSASPGPPPASPLTPTIRRSPAEDRQTIGQDASLTAKPLDEAQLIDQPPSQPFSADDSTDALALRAAISSLQFQREKARRDMRLLQQIKAQALARPEEFQDHVVKTAVAQNRAQAESKRSFVTSAGGDGEDDDDDDMSDGDESGQGTEASGAPFPAIPVPQDVVKCPPINWDKYHIVGEPLDRMHNVQTGTDGGDASGQRGGSTATAPRDPTKTPGRK